LNYITKLSDYICPAHCSGDDAKEYVKNMFKEKYVMVKTGSIIKIPLI